MSISNNHTFKFTINYTGKFILNPLTYQDGSHIKIIVPKFDFQDVLTYLKRELPTRVHSLYYALPENNTLGGMKAIKNDYDIDVMFDIAKVAGELQIFVYEHPIDISTILIPDDGSLEESFACVISEETKLKREERVGACESPNSIQNLYIHRHGEITPKTRIIPGPAGILQAAQLQKSRDITESGPSAVMPTQEYVRKIMEDASKDDHFTRGPWLCALAYCDAFGIEGIMSGTIHHKVRDEKKGYVKFIGVGAVLILKNVSVFTPKEHNHYLNITLKNMVEVFHKDTVY
ncbi:hypothetical protein CTI12_AA593870 [Artemisia annua]|uniref:Homologous recombination OB-fold protein OB-fold domain-containing protein n=1 Tax=Artemisia annua TaxID=35608 RepID=A0A2U1KJP5_ARTAN|nr:hypothetical protein CTI12_AA593870 [Artemisia annua]